MQIFDVGNDRETRHTISGPRNRTVSVGADEETGVGSTQRTRGEVGKTW